MAARRTSAQALQRWRTSGRGYAVVRTSAALLLLVAASLKAYQLATEPVLGSGLLESRWFLIGVVEFELFFGLWLLSGMLPSRFGRGAGAEGFTWLAALACFAMFTCRRSQISNAIEV
jgi:hypothetical protein